MTDIQTAKQHLSGHSLCLCKDGTILTDDGKGISPMMKLIAAGKNLNGYAAADLIVGKAAAMLFVKAGIACVHGNTMSQSGHAFLEAHHIPHTYDVLTDRIVNRTGTDICPMEQTVAELDDPNDGYAALKTRIETMRHGAAS